MKVTGWPMIDGFGLENHFSIGTCNLQPLIDIGASLVQHEGMRFGTQRDALPQLLVLAAALLELSLRRQRFDVPRGTGSPDTGA